MSTLLITLIIFGIKVQIRKITYCLWLFMCVMTDIIIIAMVMLRNLWTYSLHDQPKTLPQTPFIVSTFLV